MARDEVPVRRPITAVLAAAAALSVSLEAAGEPAPASHVAYSQSPDAAWTIFEKKDAFTARIAITGDDSTSGFLMTDCNTERGTVSYSRREFIDQPPAPVTMEIIADGVVMLSQDATADVAGYATDLIGKRDFLSAMRKLQDKKQFRMDIIGQDNRIQLSFTLRSDLGFQQAVARCSRIMQ